MLALLAMPVGVVLASETGSSSSAASTLNCSKLTSKLSSRAENLRANKKLRTAFWKSHLERWNKMVKMAQEWGLNTTQLEADIKTAEEKYNAHAVAVDTLVSKLAALKGLDCKTDSFKAAVEEVRSYHKNTVVASFESFKSFLKDTIKVDLKTLLEAAKAKKPVTNTNK